MVKIYISIYILHITNKRKKNIFGYPSNKEIYSYNIGRRKAQHDRNIKKKKKK